MLVYWWGITKWRFNTFHSFFSNQSRPVSESNHTDLCLRGSHLISYTLWLDYHHSPPPIRQSSLLQIASPPHPLQRYFSSPSSNCSWLQSVESMRRSGGVNEFQQTAKWGLIKVLPPHSLTFQSFWWSFKSLPLQMSLADSLEGLSIEASLGYRLCERVWVCVAVYSVGPYSTLFLFFNCTFLCFHPSSYVRWDASRPGQHEGWSVCHARHEGGPKSGAE